MDIILRFTFGERDAVSLLCWLGRCNARLIAERPDLPGLYASGVRYEREAVETWCDYVQLLAQKWEDCDGLAAARMGELLARGWRALSPGEGGYSDAKRLKLKRIHAEVSLTTRVEPGEHGQYHCVVRYVVNGKEYWDDPSARLGMLPNRVTAREAHDRIRTRVRLTGIQRLGIPATHQQRLAADRAAQRVREAIRMARRSA